MKRTSPDYDRETAAAYALARKITEYIAAEAKRTGEAGAPDPYHVSRAFHVCLCASLAQVSRTRGDLVLLVDLINKMTSATCEGMYDLKTKGIDPLNTLPI